MKHSIRTTPGNKTGSLPAHHDILPEGSEDSIVTVWGSHDLAVSIGDFLDRLTADPDFMHAEDPRVLAEQRDRLEGNARA